MKRGLHWLLLVPLTLTWTPGDNQARGFKIHYGTSGVYENVVNVGNITTDKRDYDFTSGQVCFAVSAYNEVGESINSNEVCLKKPSAPTALTAQVSF